MRLFHVIGSGNTVYISFSGWFVHLTQDAASIPVASLRPSAALFSCPSDWHQSDDWFLQLLLACCLLRKNLDTELGFILYFELPCS